MFRGPATDDRELDALHPFAQEEAETADAVLSRDYADLQAALKDHWDPLSVLYVALDEPDGDACQMLFNFAKRYGWKQALRAVSDVLPSQEAK